MKASTLVGSVQEADEYGDEKRIAALNRFDITMFQSLSKEDLLLAQTIAGHGDAWGTWKTPSAICRPRLRNAQRNIDIAKRINHFLKKLPLHEASVDLIELLVEEGVVAITRLALLLRLAPTSSGGTKYQRLKPSTITNKVDSYYTSIVARAIQRKAGHPGAVGLFSCLTQDDVSALGKNKRFGVEFERLATLAERGWWSDVPSILGANETTDPCGPQADVRPEDFTGEYLPLPDPYLEEFGPRNLWVIREIGPRLIPMLEDLLVYLERLDWSSKSKDELKTKLVPKFIARHLEDHPWIDHMGRPLKPSFPLKTGRKTKDKFQFPPTGWEQLKTLSAILQSAHLFLVLLSSAGRISEVDTLPRSCVTCARDGRDYVRGWTYKLSGNLFGDARTWPAPAVLVLALGQQKRLVEVWIRLPPGSIDKGLPTLLPVHAALWLSLGTSGFANPAKQLADIGFALRSLAKRIGMDPKPGGSNLHPHRLRKTIGRLAGIALFNSPTVLKRLFGHKCIEMALHYILCDKDIQTEAEKVLRELRIMHCAEVLEDVREAIASGKPLPAHGGTAASRLTDAVIDHEARLAGSGRVWTGGSAYDLAYLLTAKGKGWRFIQKDIICSKAPGETGLCIKNKGEPNTNSCKPCCDNRIVLSIARRDADEIVGAYRDICFQALEEEQFETFYYSMGQLLKELDNFPDIKEKYMVDAQLQQLLTTYKELD